MMLNFEPFLCQFGSFIEFFIDVFWGLYFSVLNDLTNSIIMDHIEFLSILKNT